MPLLRNGRPSDTDRWRLLGDDEPLPLAPGGGETSAPVVVSLARFLALAEGRREADGTVEPAGVRLAPDDDVSALAPHVARLLLVAIDFPAYTDGRGFSQARLLRERLGFGGEIRAIGDVRTDQMPFMVRAGIDAFDLAELPDEASLARALSRYRTSYQPSYALSIAG